MSPFFALYGYEASNFVDPIFGDGKVPNAKEYLQDSQDISRALKENIQVAQTARRSLLIKIGMNAPLRLGTWYT